MSIDLSEYSYLRHISVLICDDVPMMRQIVRRMLEAFGITKIFEAESAKQAFNIYLETDLNLVITDWEMPEETGLDLLRAIRWDARNPNSAAIPVVLLTSVTESEKVILARDSGMSAFIKKPVSAETLFRRVLGALDDERTIIKSSNFNGPCRRLREIFLPGERERRIEMR